MYIRKTLIMSSLEDNQNKAVCNIEKDNNGFSGNIRLYNYNSEPEGILTLAFLSEGKVVKSGLSKASNMLYKFHTEEDIDIEKMSCAVVQVNKGQLKPILYGNTNNKDMSESELKLASTLFVLDENIDKEKIEEELERNKIILEEQEEIDREIDLHMSDCESCNEKCTSCKYREAFYKLEEESKPKTNFIDGINDQLDYLFEKYPEEEFLSQIFPKSKWAKVDYEENDNYYVVGVIYEDDKIKYVCYGIPGIWQEEPPEELKGFSKWLPLDTEKPKEFGYWLSYQDAESGNNIEINIV